MNPARFSRLDRLWERLAGVWPVGVLLLINLIVGGEVARRMWLLGEGELRPQSIALFSTTIGHVTIFLYFLASDRSVTNRKFALAFLFLWLSLVAALGVQVTVWGWEARQVEEVNRAMERLER